MVKVWKKKWGKMNSIKHEIYIDKTDGKLYIKSTLDGKKETISFGLNGELTIDQTKEILKTIEYELDV